MFQHIAKFYNYNPPLGLTTKRGSIVTAAIDQGFDCPPSHHQSTEVHLTDDKQTFLTFWHWAGVSTYTSSYEFASTCSFGN